MECTLLLIKYHNLSLQNVSETLRLKAKLYDVTVIQMQHLNEGRFHKLKLKMHSM